MIFAESRLPRAEIMPLPTLSRRLPGSARGALGETANSRGSARSDWRETSRHGIVSGIIILPHFRQSTAHAGLRQENTALARSFRFRIPQPPAPRGRRDRACSQGVNPHTLGPTKVGPFLFGVSDFNVISARQRNRHRGARRSETKPRVSKDGPSASADPSGSPLRGGHLRMTDVGRLVQRRVGRAQHRAGIFAIAVLNVNHRGIDALAGNIFQRHRPAAGSAVPVADLQQIAHHVVSR